jgi:hypothetical protein
MKVLQYGDLVTIYEEASYVFMIPCDDRLTRIIEGKKETCKYGNLVRGYFNEIISISR